MICRVSISGNFVETILIRYSRISAVHWDGTDCSEFSWSLTLHLCTGLWEVFYLRQLAAHIILSRFSNFCSLSITRCTASIFLEIQCVFIPSARNCIFYWSHFPAFNCDFFHIFSFPIKPSWIFSFLLNSAFWVLLSWSSRVAPTSTGFRPFFGLVSKFNDGAFRRQHVMPRLHK